MEESVISVYFLNSQKNSILIQCVNTTNVKAVQRVSETGYQEVGLLG